MRLVDQEVQATQPALPDVDQEEGYPSKAVRVRLAVASLENVPTTLQETDLENLGGRISGLRTGKVRARSCVSVHSPRVAFPGRFEVDGWREDLGVRLDREVLVEWLLPAGGVSNGAWTG